MDENKVMTEELVDIFQSYFESEKWHYRYSEENSLFELGISTEGVIKRLSYFIDIREHSFILYAVSPIGANPSDPEAMSAMAEFICRINYGLMNGNFELDMEDGEVRFKVFVDCSMGLPNEKMIDHCIGFPLFMFERYGEGIVSVILGSATPEEAMAKCMGSVRIASSLDA